MPGQSRAEQYEKALTLAEAGQYLDALDLVEARLTDQPDNPEALNDAAVLLHCLDRSDQALEYLQRARELSPNSPEIIWNLVEAFLAEAKAEEAMALFASMEKDGILGFDVLNRAADILINQGCLTEALDMLNWSLRLAPNQERLTLIVENLRQQVQLDRKRGDRDRNGKTAKNRKP